MEETSELSGIKVRDLISVYEGKAIDPVKTEYRRPRAKSLGNLLGKNIIVRSNNFNSLEDIGHALAQIETNLDYYQEYNKEIHVKFQEELFNILTWIINIENKEGDDPLKKKELITRTQTLVSFLNQKLPSNAAAIPKPLNKYRTYADYIQEINGERSVESKAVSGIASENATNSTVNNNNEVIMSVRKLKQYFQPNNTQEEKSTLTRKLKESTSTAEISENNFKTVYSIKLTNNKNAVAKYDASADSTDGSKNVETTDAIAVSQNNPISIQEDETKQDISVSKLRSLFETKSKESGLEVILKERVAHKTTFRYDVNIPYTQRNLEQYRLHRLNSGNYINNSGLLINEDISRSKSMHNLHYESSHFTVKQSDTRETTDEENDNKSDTSIESDVESVKSIDEINVDHSSAAYGMIFQK